VGNRGLHLMAYGGIGVCVFFVWFRCFTKNIASFKNLCHKTSQKCSIVVKQWVQDSKMRTRSNYEVIGDVEGFECSLVAKAIINKDDDDTDHENNDNNNRIGERRNSRTLDWNLQHLKSTNSLYRAI